MTDEHNDLIVGLRTLAGQLPEQADLLLTVAALLDGWEPVLCGECHEESLSPVCACPRRSADPVG